MNEKEIISLMKTRDGRKVTEKDFLKIIEEDGWRFNAAGRINTSSAIHLPTPFSSPAGTKEWLIKSSDIGGLKPGYTMRYPTYSGYNVIKVCSLDDLPEKMVNPKIVCFSGYLAAWVLALEILRRLGQETDTLTEILAIGKECNKGLYKDVYEANYGLIRNTEYETYLNTLEQILPRSFVRKNQQIFEDIDTAGNLRELYRFAREKGMKEVTYILATGQPWYDKRVVGEFPLPFILNPEEYKDVKVNFVLVHSPLWLTGHLPENSVNPIAVGYSLASIGPLLQNYICLQDDYSYSCFFEKKERVNHLPNELLIRTHPFWKESEPYFMWGNNMGWPDYEIRRYDCCKQKAIEHIHISHLVALSCISKQKYESGLEETIKDYKSYFSYLPADNASEKEILEWCKESPKESYFDKIKLF